MKILAGSLSVASAVVALSGPFPAVGAPVPVGTYVYVHDRTTDGRVHGFSLSKEGLLVALPDSPFDSSADGGGCGGYCETMAYSKKRKMLFTGGEDGGMGAFRVLPGGALEEVAGSPFGAAGGGLWGTGVVQKGKRTFVYGSAFETDQVRGFEVQADGTLVELPASPFAAGNGPDGLAAVKNKVFAANEGEGTISSYVVAADGTLVPSGDPVPVADVDFVYNVNPDPTGKYLYVGGCDGSVAVFRVDRKTAALTPLEGSPFGAGVGSTCGGVAVSKKHVLVPDSGGGPSANLQVFRRGKGGVLAPLGDLQGTGIMGATCGGLDPKGRTLLVTNGTLLQALSLNPRTGVATAGAPLPYASVNINCLVVVRR